MRFRNEKAQIYVPDGTAVKSALNRTTSLCIAAHQDDTEIMAYNAIAECYGVVDKWFTSVIVTDGAGSPRDGIYARFTDEEMKDVRAEEQNSAAKAGGYSAQVQLHYRSKEVKSIATPGLIAELEDIILACSPQVVYTHNLADKHDTHVATVLRTISALRELPKEKRPEKLYGMEVWRSLDWLADTEKAVFDASDHENVAAAVLGVFDSQICGGKRYDLAAMGRRRANATFLGDHSIDTYSAAIIGIDMTELLEDTTAKPEDFICKKIDAFKKDVAEKLGRMGK